MASTASKAAAKKKPAARTPQEATSAATKTPAKSRGSTGAGKSPRPARGDTGRPANAATRDEPRKTAATPAAARPITPRQALANTRKLLKAKQAQARGTPPWQALEGHHGHGHPAAGATSASDPGHGKGEELHAAESRMQAIQGSVGTQGRHDQGKRDKR